MVYYLLVFGVQIIQNFLDYGDDVLFAGLWAYIWWILLRYVNLAKSDEWMIESISIGVKDYSNSIIKINDKIVQRFIIEGFYIDNVLIKKILIKLNKIVPLVNTTNEFTIQQVFGMAKNSEMPYVTLRRPDGKTLEYMNITECTIKERKYLHWRPYKIIFQKIGDTNTHIQGYTVSLSREKNDWNI